MSNQNTQNGYRSFELPNAIQQAQQGFQMANTLGIPMSPATANYNPLPNVQVPVAAGQQSFWNSSIPALGYTAPATDLSSLQNYVTPNGQAPNLNVPGANANSSWSNAPWFKAAFGDKNGGGWVNPAIQGVSALANAWFSKENLDVAKDTLALNRDVTMANLDNQEMAFEIAYNDRLNARLSANPNGNYRTLESYKKERTA